MTRDEPMQIPEFGAQRLANRLSLFSSNDCASLPIAKLEKWFKMFNNKVKTAYRSKNQYSYIIRFLGIFRSFQHPQLIVVRTFIWGSSSGGASHNGSRGLGFDSCCSWELGFFFFLFPFLCFNQWYALNQVPCGGATLLVFTFTRITFNLSSAA